MNSNGPGGTSGAHTTCCEERPACLHGSQCLLSAQASWLCPSGSKRICILHLHFFFLCVCVRAESCINASVVGRRDGS